MKKPTKRYKIKNTAFQFTVRNSADKDIEQVLLRYNSGEIISSDEFEAAFKSKVIEVLINKKIIIQKDTLVILFGYEWMVKCISYDFDRVTIVYDLVL